MKRFSPMQTLSNFVTAVRETVDSVNKKIFATTALTALAICAGLVFTQASLAAGPNVTGTSTVAKPPTAQQQAAAIEEAKAEAARTAVDRARDRANIRKEARDLRKERTEACSAAKATPTNKELQEECDALEGEVYQSNPGASLRETRDANKLSETRRECEKLVDTVTRDEAKASEACGKAGFAGRLGACYDKVSTCKADENGIDDLDPEDEGGAGPFCDKALANRCPGLSVFNESRDFKQEEKDAKKDQKEAKRDLDDAMKKQREEKIDLAKAQREMRENEEDQALANRDAERALANSLKKALEGLSEDQKAAFEAAQGTFTKMEAEYMKMRKEARDATDMVEQAKDDLQVMCRASAEKKFTEAEKARLAALAARKKNVGAGTNVSGAAKRTKAAADRARQTNYVAFFNECASSPPQSADGVGGYNRIKTAERAKASADKFLAEKSQLIEKERANMLEKLKQMEQDATNRKAKIVEEMNDKLERENENRLSIAKKNAARAAEFSQRQQLSMQSTQDDIDRANKDLQDAQREGAVAGTLLACQGRNGSRSESKRDRLEEGFGSSIGAINGTYEGCNKVTRTCPASVPSFCSALATSKDAYDKKRSTRK